MKKRIPRLISFSALFLSILCLGGCGDKQREKEAERTDTFEFICIDQQIRGTLCKGVMVDAKCPDLNSIEAYDVIEMQMRLPEESVMEDMKTYLFTEAELNKMKEERNSEDQMIRYVLPGAGEEELKSFTINYAPASKGIYIGNDQAYPYPLLSYDRSILPVQGMEIYPFLDLQQKDLSFMKCKEAIDMVQDQLKKWEIYPVKDPLVYAMDGEILYQTLEEWNKIDYVQTSLDGVTPQMLECYYMIFDIGYQNIPYTFLTREVEGIYVDGARLWIYVTENGIVQMEYRWADYEVKEVLEEYEDCISVEKALEQVKTYFEEMVVVSDVTISEIYFQYVAIQVGQQEGSYVFAPAWVFQPSGIIQGEEVYLDPVIIHGITGETL